jgi:uroporphyrinogen III methyltransferase / synthase
VGCGRVCLIGAGPGSPDLISVRGLRRLAAADVVVYDELLSENFPHRLGISLGNKQLIWLGSTRPRRKQDEINALMLEAARAGRSVARVKTGDPFIFGRGLEEIEFLAAQGISVEVVPGISSALGAATGAGLALTHRGESLSFAVVTARCEGGGVNAAWPDADNLVVLMGVKALAEVCSALQADGRSSETPVAIVERAGLYWERRVYGTLATICADAAAAGLASPAVVIVGPAAASRDVARRKLVLFTGLDPSNFRFLGDLLHWPALELVEEPTGYELLPAALEKLRAGEFDHAVFTSRAGVDSFFAALAERRLDSRVLAGCIVIAAGGGTAGRLAENGIRADHVPELGGSPGILKEIRDQPRSVLLVQGTHAPRGLEKALEEMGAEVLRLALHTIRPHPELGRGLPRHDVIYFVSPSGVRAYHDEYGAAAFEQEVWCIGAATQGQIESLGISSEVVDPHES